METETNRGTWRHDKEIYRACYLDGGVAQMSGFPWTSNPYDRRRQRFRWEGWDGGYSDACEGTYPREF